MRAHADDLRAEVENEDLVAAIVCDWRDAPLGEVSERAPTLAWHAAKLTSSPATVTEADIDVLREAGCDDGVIADLTQVVALFAYFNRIADGLGIDPEPEWT